ncbi:porin [Acidocella sp.]|uniref:porin n=1 Tax=Acidocella sp. TaxID=50710 RepID=UPI003D026F23
MRELLLASAATLLAAGTAFAQPAKQVAAPGSIVVHLHGYLQFGFGAYGSNGMTNSNYKLSNTGSFGDVRIYPGFDAQTVNGIWYGAQVELRTTTSSAGKGVTNNSNASQGDIYVRRAYGYIGMPEYGFVRFGQTDSAFSLLQTGVIEKFGDVGQFHADGGQNMLYPGTAPGNFIYANQGPLYTTDKIVYLTPTVDVLAGGLSGAIGFEPNSNGLKEGYASTGSTSGANVSSLAGGSNSRRRNTIDVMVAYKNKLAGFANKVSFGYLHGSPLGSTNGSYGASAPYGYDELSVFQAGAQTTYAGLTVGANIKTGQVEDGYTFKPKGARDALSYIVGATYEVGPYILGVSYFNGQSSGAYVPGSTGVARTLSEYGVAVGGNYAVAKPLSLFVQYEYGHKHQPGATGSTWGANGNAQVQSIAVGATMKW